MMEWTALTGLERKPISPYAHFARCLAEPTSGPRHLYPLRKNLGTAAWSEMISMKEFAALFGEFDDEIIDLLPENTINPARLPGRDRRGPPPPGTVFVGIIDDGFAFAHERFRLEQPGEAPLTRFDDLWLQGVPCDGRRDVPLGRRLTGPDIDELLARYRTGAGIDEDALYRDPAVGMIDFGRGGVEDEVQMLALARSHGTAVADAAAGYRPGRPRGRRVRILGVALPPRVTSDTLGVFTEPVVSLAIEHIYAHVEARRAEAIERWGEKVDYPLVINISLALTAGAKDGGSVLDRLIDEITNRRQGRAPVRFVLPAGNHRQWMTHAVLDAPGKVTWRLPPDDLTPSFVEIWGCREKPERPGFSVSLTPPGGGEGAPIPATPFGCVYLLTDGGESLAWAYRDWIGNQACGRERVVLVVPPTAGEGRRAFPGEWCIRVDAEAGIFDAPVNLYVQRDDTLPGGRRRGRQSYFVDPDYVDYDDEGRVVLRDDPGRPGVIRRSGTMNSLATSRAAIVVGGRFRQSRTEVAYGGLAEADITSDAPRWKRVSRLASSERSPWLEGVLAAGSRSGARQPIAGTSIACARVTRKLAKDLLFRYRADWRRWADGSVP
ncbi:hypothetical protein [Amaricoccus solimangrovi]|uniref:Peptidase S8/S53 domain-containing protein n=1 Tax=Amaricoccus solimangrovi TaxID=2589815 RepID=A0A501WSI7_9RHOB|nr:hypothetical protein [Amaricoccus solimangrovi]TPE52683.1 hypothetical protein FJM51_05775 [Amaricoccus solimangrovi]